MHRYACMPKTFIVRPHTPRERERATDELSQRGQL
jgi:hypothetical protein